jgi:hypothetical protein
MPGRTYRDGAWVVGLITGSPKITTGIHNSQLTPYARTKKETSG